MTDINYSSADLAYMEQLREYITEYCQTNNIDPATYVAALDGEIDINLKDDPAFQAYWQLASLQLAYILSGGAVDMSVPGDVAYDQESIEAAYAAADAELLALCESLLQDQPELLAFFTMQTDGVSSGNDILAAINLSESNTTEETSTSEDSSEDSDGESWTSQDTRDFIEAYGGSEGLDWLIDYEEGIRAAEQSILNYVAEMDQQLVELTEMFNSGEISAEEYSAKTENLSIYRETLLAMLQQLESSLSTVMEMYSKLIEQANEMSMAVINNMRPV